jgi:hypothetical protein
VLRTILIGSLLIFATSCTREYHARNPVTKNGYSETELGDGKFLVQYHGMDLEFCKKAAYYRVAELCVEKGFQYFSIVNEQVWDGFTPKTSDVGVDDTSTRVVGPDTNSAGLQSKGAVGYNYTSQFYMKDPGIANVVNAVDFLRTSERP